MPTIIETIEIHVMSRPALDERLEDAVKQLQDAAALTRTRGILIIRHQPGGTRPCFRTKFLMESRANVHANAPIY